MEEDSCPTQNGSHCESTNSIESVLNVSTHGDSSQSNSSQYTPSQYNNANATVKSTIECPKKLFLHDIELDIPVESAEVRAAQLMELVKTGDNNELQQKITSLIKENDMLRTRLNQMNTYSKDNELILRKMRNAKQTEPPEEDFCIDAVPSQCDQPLDERSENQEGKSPIKYDTINNGEKLALSTPKSADDSISKNGKLSTNCCFNCMGSHMIAECKEPIDQRQVFKNRRSFQLRQGVQTVTSGRYHVEEEQKFGHIKPGQKPSRSLRRALGLKDSRYLPPYIYQMRKLGYPPAWMKYAQINPSGLSLYMARGTPLEEYVSDVNNGEDGEISFNEQTKEAVKYDVDKLIGWHGFNVEPDKDYIEESRRYRAPSLQLDRPSQNFQSLEFMKQKLAAHQQKGYVRGEMQNTNVSADSSDSKAGKKEIIDRDVIGINESDTSANPQCSSKFQSAGVINTDHGTPIVDTFSPYSELPSTDKWTSFTTDHIFFENLPESTGKYDKMVDILKKCRDAKKQIEKLAVDSKTSDDTTPAGS